MANNNLGQGNNDSAWMLVFKHDISGGLFESDAQALSFNGDAQDPESVSLYSILNELENLRSSDGKLHFKLVYPDLPTKTNEWKQTSNPTTTLNTVQGYEPIDVNDVRGLGWRGLSKSSSIHTFIDGTPGNNNWWYAIGSQSQFGGGLPGPEKVSRVELYIYLEQGPLFHAKLDSEAWVDSSHHHHSILPVGSAQITRDSEFGEVLYLDGSSWLDLPDAQTLGFTNASFSLSGWIKMDPNAHADAALTILGTERLEVRQGLHLTIQNAGGLRHVPFFGFFGNDTYSKEKLSLGRWYHLAFVYDITAQTQSIYVDGVLSVVGSNKPSMTGTDTVFIGKSLDGRYFKGWLSNLRIYSHVLSQDAIRHDMYLDNAGFSYHELLPLAFGFYNETSENTLYIDNALTDQEAILEIQNIAGEPLRLPAIGSPGANAYHFALRFRRGTLASVTNVQVVNDGHTQWAIAAESASKVSDGVDTLYLAATSELAIIAGQTINVRLKNIGGDPGHGTRGSRVQIQVKNIESSRTSAEISLDQRPRPLEFTRELYLQLVNHRGKPVIPLHLGFVGSSTVLNDGQAKNTLTLRISSLHVDGSGRPGHEALTLTKESKIIFSFDTDIDGDKDEWCLGSTDKIKSININVKGSTGWSVKKDVSLPKTFWVLTAASSNSTRVLPHHLEFEVDTIVTDYPTGKTQIRANYENIQGYMDGYLVAEIEKQPLSYKGNLIGLGAVPKQYQATIGNPGNRKQMLIEGGWGNGAGDHSRINFNDENFGIGAGTYSNQNWVGKDALVLWSSGGPHRGILFGSVPHWKNVKFSELRHNLFIAGDTGNVGIGTTDPKIDLAIGDNGTGFKSQGDGELAIYTDNIERVRFASDGTVGIGGRSEADVPLFVKSTVSHGTLAVFESSTNSCSMVLDVDANLTKRVLFTNTNGVASTWVGQPVKPALTILPNGNVGIGTTDPKIDLAIGDNDTGFKHVGDGELAVYTNNKERVRFASDGTVGIGGRSVAGVPIFVKSAISHGTLGLFESSTNTCSLALDVEGSLEKRLILANVNGACMISTGKPVSPALTVLPNGYVGVGIDVFNPSIDLAISDAGTGLKRTDWGLAICVNNSERIQISDNSQSLPWVKLTSRLLVDGHFGWTKSDWDNWFDKFGFHNTNAERRSHEVSIVAAKAVAAEAYLTYSDLRIKKVLGTCDTSTSLSLINALNIVEYKYVDSELHGTDAHKGFIAQQVEELYPSAVSTKEDFVPDIFEMSSNTSYKESTGCLSISLSQSHGLKLGDIVRIVGRNGPVEAEVVAVLSDREFTVTKVSKEDIYEGKVFVHGKRVNDYRVVNYQELSVIGLSAIQALTKQNEVQQSEIEKLTQRLDKLEQLLANLQQQEELQ